MHKILLWSLIIPMILFCFCVNSGSSQPSEGNPDDVICQSIPDSKELAHRLQDYELVRQLNQVKDQRIANLEKEVELLNKELELKDKIIAITEREVASTRRALEDMKGVVDRALELAKIGKKSTLQEILEWVIRVAIFVGAYMLAK